MTLGDQAGWSAATARGRGDHSLREEGLQACGHEGASRDALVSK